MPYGAIDVPDAWPQQMRAAQDALKEQTERIEALLGAAGCSGEVRPVLSATADLKDTVVASARVSDVAVLSPSLRDRDERFRAALHALLFHAPIGVVLNGSALAPAPGVFVAWDDSAPAARAVHLALPVLKAAEEVVIACFDPLAAVDGQPTEPGADVALWLSHHGCTVRVAQFPSGGAEIGAAIQARAAEAGSDLIVMGAYGHARMRQAVFGGTTRTLMTQTDTRVFLAH